MDFFSGLSHGSVVPAAKSPRRARPNDENDFKSPRSPRRARTGSDDDKENLRARKTFATAPPTALKTINSNVLLVGEATRDAKPIRTVVHARSPPSAAPTTPFLCDDVEVRMGSHWYGARIVARVAPCAAGGRPQGGFLVNYDYEKSSAPFFASCENVRRSNTRGPAATRAAAAALGDLFWLSATERAAIVGTATSLAAGPLDGGATDRDGAMADDETIDELLATDNILTARRRRARALAAAVTARAPPPSREDKHITAVRAGAERSAFRAAVAAAAALAPVSPTSAGSVRPSSATSALRAKLSSAFALGKAKPKARA